MITIEYRCADGTPFPVVFDQPEHAARPWAIDREHNRDPLTPLGDALGRLAHQGAQRAYAEAGLPFPPSFVPGPRAAGFAYFSTDPISPEDFSKMFGACAVLVETYGSAKGIWHDLCRPNSRNACDLLDSADESVPLAVLAELEGYSMHMTMIPAYVLGNDTDLLAAVCPPQDGLDARSVVLELTQGYECETVRADHELWSLGRAARHSPAVMDALASDDVRRAMDAVRQSGEAREFLTMLDDFLVAFGRRSEGWDIALPTWSEQAPGFWAQVRHMTADSTPDPSDAVAKGEARREALRERLRAALADEPDKLARFERRVDRVAPYVDVREDRAHWQLVGTGCLRHAVLRRGAALVERGWLDEPADVLYLEVDEVENAAGDVRALAASRRAEHEHRKTLTPPPAIGGDTAEAAETAEPTSIVVMPDDRIVRGMGASRGLVTGTARVVLDLADADRVQPGDVLVCVMTSPPWTALFGVAAAIVTDTGSPGSHPAIAAREYGIAAVVGAGIATSVIPDGATVTVDGTAGTVTVH